MYPFLNYLTDDNNGLFLLRLQSWFRQGRQETSALISSLQIISEILLSNSYYQNVKEIPRHFL